MAMTDSTAKIIGLIKEQESVIKTLENSIQTQITAIEALKSSVELQKSIVESQREQIKAARISVKIYHDWIKENMANSSADEACEIIDYAKKDGILIAK
jgi:uncharacterized protein YqiB (DUF1249 family)